MHATAQAGNTIYNPTQLLLDEPLKYVVRAIQELGASPVTNPEARWLAAVAVEICSLSQGKDTVFVDRYRLLLPRLARLLPEPL